ncbi:hypothetical protein [Microcoleus sp. bin38.metabat.b11b12b14.051]|nr:hypothetical protein [Microcoleus sp. bin38.metabat.b11b12b14.051]
MRPKNATVGKLERAIAIGDRQISMENVCLPRRMGLKPPASRGK